MKDLPWFRMKWVQLLFSGVLAVSGGFLFQWIHSPYAWLFGPMVFVFAGSRLFKSIKPYWSGKMRDTGVIIVGYILGLSFSLETFQQIGYQLPFMILLTAMLLICSYLIALLVAKWSGLHFPTVLMGSVPGGLTQMTTLAEEIKGIDITVITFLHASRIIMTVFFIPLLVFSPLFGASLHHSLPGAGLAAAASWGALFPNILVYAVVCTGCALLWKKIKFPNAFLLGPMVATIVLHLSGFPGPELPTSFVSLAQLFIGGYLGLSLKPERLQNKFKIILFALLSGMALLFCSVVLSLLLTQLHAVPLSTSFLSLAPGGVDQMGLFAKEINADLSFITCYQLFRTLFIFLVISPVLKAIFNATPRRRTVDQVT